MKSSRTKGDKLENYVSAMLRIPKTTNSGAALDNADLKSAEIMIECKFTSQDSITISKTILKKLINQAAKWHIPSYAIVTENKIGTFITVPFKDYLSLKSKAENYSEDCRNPSACSCSCTFGTIKRDRHV